MKTAIGIVISAIIGAAAATAIIGPPICRPGDSGIEIGSILVAGCRAR